MNNYTTNDDLRADLISSEDNLGDALLAVKQPLTRAEKRTQHDKNSEIVSIRDFYNENDGEDYSPALTKALAAGVSVFIPPGKYILRATVSIPSNSEIYGIAGSSILASPEAVSSNGAELITVLVSDGADNIYLHDFRVDGGCNELVTIKRSSRGIRLRDSTNIRFENMEVSRTADWATSFERCKNVWAINYKHVQAEGPLTGGRDGFHCLDCENVVLDGADIDSGDDCASATSETVGSYNITFRNIRGSSDIGSIAIYNEERDSTQPSGYARMDASNLHFEDIRVKKGGTARSVVRIAKYNPDSIITDCSVVRASGQSSASHAAHFSGINGLCLSGIDVSATKNGHGVYITSCQSVRGDVKGTTLVPNYDGVQIYNCSGVDLSAESFDAANYGIHINGLTRSVIRPKAINCGSKGFSSSVGGGMRIVNCSNVDVPSGIMYGDSSSSYYGLLYASGNSNINIGSGVITQGYIDSANLPIEWRLHRPKVILSFKEGSDGLVTTNRAYGCTLTRISKGYYEVTFNSSMNSTGFAFSLQAFHVGAQRHVILASAITQTGFTFKVLDNTDSVVYSDNVKLIAYDS
ncbi:glycosyl hydrolase family 28 protein [Klebsiella sp. CN_Kp114]|uniref:glycosyl hydrolase family 28 protein n=1 Tax=Klebsiella TaxID=570 RepID=UPI001CC9C990|nr:glycosyl hydrolase family 28 protein [Klebsiella michiganensis]MBZ7507703.1 hypothetical protein [Klebsiella michiganensis]